MSETKLRYEGNAYSFESSILRNNDVHMNAFLHAVFARLKTYCSTERPYGLSVTGITANMLFGSQGLRRPVLNMKAMESRAMFFFVLFELSILMRTLRTRRPETAAKVLARTSKLHAQGALPRGPKTLVFKSRARNSSIFWDRSGHLPPQSSSAQAGGFAPPMCADWF